MLFKGSWTTRIFSKTNGQNQEKSKSRYQWVQDKSETIEKRSKLKYYSSGMWLMHISANTLCVCVKSLCMPHSHTHTCSLNIPFCFLCLYLLHIGLGVHILSTTPWLFCCEDYLSYPEASVLAYSKLKKNDLD